VWSAGYDVDELPQPGRDPLQGDFAGKAGEHAQNRGRCLENSHHGKNG
jgi:hypothetical protein